MRYIATFLMLIIGVSCATGDTASSSKRVGPTASNGSVPLSRATEGPDLAGIEGLTVPGGRCGMVLYALSGSRTLPIFRSTDDGMGVMDVEGEMVSLTLVGRGGDTRMGVPSAQYFRGVQAATGNHLSVSIDTVWGDGFPSGAYVKEGTVTVTAADGWTRLVPVAGLAGCRAAA